MRHHLCHFWSLQAFDDDLFCCRCTVPSMHRRITAYQRHGVGIDISVHIHPRLSRQRRLVVSRLGSWSRTVSFSPAHRLVCPSRVTTYHNCSSVWMHARPPSHAYCALATYSSSPPSRSWVPTLLAAAKREMGITAKPPWFAQIWMWLWKTLSAPYTDHDRPPSWWSHFRTRIPPSTTFCSSRHLWKRTSRARIHKRETLQIVLSAKGYSRRSRASISYLEYQSEIRMGSSPTPSPNSASEALPKASYVTHASAPALSPLLLPAVGDEAQDARRPSIQFLPHSKAGLPRGSQKPGRAQRRMSSPPPPPWVLSISKVPSSIAHCPFHRPFLVSLLPSFMLMQKELMCTWEWRSMAHTCPGVAAKRYIKWLGRLYPYSHAAATSNQC